MTGKANKSETFEMLCTELETIINDLTEEDQYLIFKVISVCDLMQLATKIRDQYPEKQRLHLFLHIMNTFEYEEFYNDLLRLEKDFALRLISALEFILFDTKQQFSLNHYL